MPPAKPSTSDSVYQLKVTLKGIRPPCGRHLLHEPDTSLDTLHQCHQEVVGLYDSHLHQFVVGRTLYGVPDPDFDFGPEVEDEKRVALRQVAPAAKSKLTYEYDF